MGMRGAPVTMKVLSKVAVKSRFYQIA